MTIESKNTVVIITMMTAFFSILSMCIENAEIKEIILRIFLLI